MKIITNNENPIVKVVPHKDASIMQHSSLPQWRLAVVLVLLSVLWTLWDTTDGFGGSLADAIAMNAFRYADAEKMHTYTVVNGLVGPVVPVIFQDSRGSLWFGSESGGVSRFDGDNFEQFRLEDDLASGVTEEILEDRWGHVWFLTRLPTEPEGIVSYFNGTNIETVGAATCMTVDSNGNIWVANNQGLTHYTSSYPIGRAYDMEGPADATINVLFQSKDGTFYLGGSAAGGILLLSFDPNTGFKDEVLEAAKHVPVLAPSESTFAIHDIAQEAYGIERLWFAGPNLLLQFDGETIHQILPDPQNMNPSNIQAENLNDAGLHYDRFHNRIWFSNQGRSSWSDRNSLKKLPQSLEFGILKMQETWGDLWFASSTGAYRRDPELRNSDHLTTADGLGSDNIQTILQGIDGKIWFGHDNGTTVFNPRPAYVKLSTRSALGSNSVGKIIDKSFPWFSVLGGIVYSRDERFYLYKLPLKRKMPTLNMPLTWNMPEEPQSDSPPETSPKPVEIINVFQDESRYWLINRTQQTPTEMIYTFFAKEPGVKIEQLTIRVQTEMDRQRHPEVFIRPPQVLAFIEPGEGPQERAQATLTFLPPYIAFGGWLFEPYSKGLVWLSPEGRHTFPFQDELQFEDIPTIEHGPAAIVDMHTSPHGGIWCYLEDGTIQSGTNIDRKKVPMTHIKPLRLPNPKLTSDRASENATPKWFFNTEKKQILYWDIEKFIEKQDIENLEDPTVVEDVFTVPPIAIWESADAAETTFIFSDHLTKYHGTQRTHEEEVNVAEVRAALLTDAQVLWLATKQGAVRYDGTTLKTYGIDDGFLVNDLRDVYEDTIGNIWFATWGGGAVRYDGKTFTPVTTRDGLAHNSVSDIHQSEEGYIWFATEGGITRYRPADGALPFCNITAVNDESYTRLRDTDFAFPSHVNDITLHFEGINPLRLRHQLTYEFKLLGVGENDWTRGSAQQDEVTQTFANGATQTFAINTATDEDPSVTYQGLKPGKYTFLVKTYRKGWPYTSAPAAVNFTIDPPFWAQWRSYLPYLILIGLLITIVPYLLARLLVNRRQVARLHAEMQEKEEAEMQQLRAELDEARNMQEALLPTEVPEVEGLDVAGMSLPATQVGGDFYDYLNAGEKHLAIAVADAAGKGLRGALNAVLTNGMLNEIVQIQYSADVILTNLNASLVPRLYGRTFIALNLAIIDTEDKRIFYANAGQPYPILKRGDTLIEIEASELPLGGMKRTEYGQEQLELVPGDIYIFYTDGVIEALNSEEEMYGTERLKSVLAEAPQHLSAEELIEYIFTDIQAFVQTAEQYDDITIVVVRHQPTTQ